MRLQLPIEHTQLSNGLRLVLAPDLSVPVVTVGVYYRVGFRSEPKGRSGFAHLFEHMMFQGSANVPKMQHVRLVNASGGRPNGATDLDTTSFYQAVPSNALERVLWLEADRMRALKVSQENLSNQRNVVKEEIHSSVINQPYGGFPWLDMPQVAFRNWANAHNFYGDFSDLDAATLEDVRSFFKTYYVPNNAVVLMLGDVRVEEGFALAEKQFGEIPSGTEIPFPDTTEPRQEEERRGFVDEAFGTLPALAVGYLMPKRLTKDWYSIALVDHVLHNGKTGRIYRELVLEKQIAVEAHGGMSEFGCSDPTQMTTSIKYRPECSNEEALNAFDSVIRNLQESGVTPNELEQVKVKWRSSFYSQLDSGGQILPKAGLMQMLGCFTLLDNNAGLVNTIAEGFLTLTCEEILSAARRYLREKNRAIVFRLPTRTAQRRRGNGVPPTADIL